ncbi:MAG: lactonase family protein [Chitinophagaceae bacterium]|nr:lactonase family protein [Chitinophagaceae bacterium]
MKKWLLLLSLLTYITGATQHFYLFAGTYTNNGSKGIYVYDFDADNGTVRLLSHTDSAENPSYLCVSQDGNFLYAVNEVDIEQSGKVSAYHFDRRSSKLQFINQQRTGGAHPCHISVTGDGKTVFVANYSGGNIAAFPVGDNGALMPAVQLIQHTGKGADPVRQTQAHVHAVSLSPDEKYLLTPDLGTDKIHVYRYDRGSSKLEAGAKQGFIESAPGSGPRQLCFSANGKFVYVVEELSGMLTAYSFQRGVLKKLQSYTGHQPGAGNNHGSADVQMSPDGAFLYMSNRGEENTLAIFKVDQKTGLLTPAGIRSTEGNHPRNMLIDPTGRYLLVGNMKSNEVVVFRREMGTGQLQVSGRFSIPSPSCLQMIPR